MRPVFATLLAALFFAGLWLTIFNAFHLNNYYASQASLAYEEKAIGEKLREEHASNFYYYNVTTLGSIMYYSQLVQPLDLNVQLAPPPSGTCILYAPDSRRELVDSHPSLELQNVYSGTALALDCVD